MRSKTGIPVAESEQVRQLRDEVMKGYKEKRNNAMILVMIIGGLAAANAFLIWLAFFHFPLKQFAATSNAAAVCNVTPVTEPLVHHQTVADFAVDAAIGIYSFDHVNYKRQLTDVTNRFFTSEYRNEFMVVFGDSAILQTVKDNYYIVSATKGGRPAIIVKAGVVKGVYKWKVQVPLIVEYTSGRKNEDNRILATVEVSRVAPSTLNPRGIAVSDIQTGHQIN